MHRTPVQLRPHPQPWSTLKLEDSCQHCNLLQQLLPAEDLQKGGAWRQDSRAESSLEVAQVDARSLNLNIVGNDILFIITAEM